MNDYTGVLIPLDQAHLHSYSARCGRMEYEEVPGGDEEEEDNDFPKHRAGDDQEGMAMLEMNAVEYSVEGLRREVRKGADGMRSDYESWFCTSQPVSLGDEALSYVSGSSCRDAQC